MRKILALIPVLFLTGCSAKTITEIKYVDREIPVIQYVDREIVKEVEAEVDKPVYIEKEVIIENEIIKEVEVPVEILIEKEIIREIPVETIVEKEIIKEVEVPKCDEITVTFMDDFPMIYNNLDEVEGTTFDWLCVSVSSYGIEPATTLGLSPTFTSIWQGELEGPIYEPFIHRLVPIKYGSELPDLPKTLPVPKAMSDLTIEGLYFLKNAKIEMIRRQGWGVDVNTFEAYQIIITYEEAYRDGVDILVDQNGWKSVEQLGGNTDKYDSDFYAGKEYTGLFRTKRVSSDNRDYLSLLGRGFEWMSCEPRMQISELDRYTGSFYGTIRITDVSNPKHPTFEILEYELAYGLSANGVVNCDGVYIHSNTMKCTFKTF